MCSGAPGVGCCAAWKTIPPIAHLLNHLLAGEALDQAARVEAIKEPTRPRRGAGPDRLVQAAHRHQDEPAGWDHILTARLTARSEPHWHQDGPAGWDGETIELSGHGPRDGARALFFTCSEATVHECAYTNIYQQPGPCSCPVLQATGAAGRSQRSLAREYGVTQTAIRLIVIRKNWAHLPEE